MINFLFLVTLLIYLAASIFHTLSLAIGNRSEVSGIRPAIERIAFWCTIIGFAFLTVFIALWWLQQGHFPMTHWTDSIAFFRMGNHADLSNHCAFDAAPHARQLRHAGGFYCDTHFIQFRVTHRCAPEPLQNYWLLAHTSLIFSPMLHSSPPLDLG